jgi:hypothetical protein
MLFAMIRIVTPGQQARSAVFAPDLAVIAGLDPAIHPLQRTLAKGMDARVKPAHDERWGYGRAEPGHDFES